MNENLNLVEKLQNCPKGTRLYSLLHGSVAFKGISDDKNFIYVSIYPIGGSEMTEYFLPDGRIFDSRYKGECILFPNNINRDWNNFEIWAWDDKPVSVEFGKLV